MVTPSRHSHVHTRAAAALLLAAVLPGCEPPDRPRALPVPLPAAVEAYLAPDTIRTVRIADGVHYRYLWSPLGPWAVHLLEADLSPCQRGLEVLAAPREEGMRGGRAPVSELVRLHGGKVLAAVNGDFFTPEGMPLGPEVAGGIRRTGRVRPALASRGGERVPWIGTTGVGVDRVEALGWYLGDTGPGAVHVMGGYPELLDGGRPVGDLLVAANPGFAASRHPRTAVAVSLEEPRLWLVVVDGRQGPYSTGMTLPELAGLLEALGAEEGLNLDGGGSSVLVVRGRPVNRPSDEAGEREVVNALLLVDDPARCRSFTAPGSP